MDALRKFTLGPDLEQPGWTLTEDRTQRVVQRFASKTLATRRGALESALGKEGGSVKIQIGNGVLEEARTFPGAANARGSTGLMLLDDYGSDDTVEPHLRARGKTRFR